MSGVTPPGDRRPGRRGPAVVLLRWGREAAMAARAWRRRPLAALVAAGTLGIGMAAVASVVALADALFLAPLVGIGAPEELVTLRLERGPASQPNVRDLRERTRALASLASFVDQLVTVGSGEGAERAGALLVDEHYFPTLRVPLALGRAWGREEAATGAAVTVIGHDLWRRRFAGDPAVLGREVEVQGEPFVVIGVAPPGFIGTFRGFRFDLWVPLQTAPRVAPTLDLADRAFDRAELVGRLRPGVSHAAVAAELVRLSSELAAEHPHVNRELRVTAAELTGLDEELRRPALVAVGVLLALAGLVLALTVANVAGLLAARLLARRGELALRAALGATGLALGRLLLWEALLVALAGALLGAVGAAGIGRLLLRAVADLPVPLALDLAPSPRSLALLAAGALLVAALLASPAAASVARSGLLATLRATGGGATGRSRGRSLLVVVQMAAATALLLAAGVAVRALQQARGGDEERLATVLAAPFLDLQAARLDPAAELALRRRLLATASAVPGVEAAALASRPPLPGGASVEVWPAEQWRRFGGGSAGDRPGVPLRVTATSEGYPSVLGLTLREGRWMASGGGEGSELVVDVEAVARLWPRDLQASVLGRRLRVGEEELTVVGVCDSLRGPAGEARPTLYRSLWTQPGPRFALLVRGREGVGGLVPALRDELRRAVPALAAVELQPLVELRAVALLPQRLAAGAAGLLGGLGLLLAAAGLYALLALLLAQAARELAVRAALGASPRHLLAGVARRAVALAALGFTAGAALLLAVAPLLTRGLGGALDAGVLAVTFAAVALAALAAAFTPAWRAAHTDPARTLRAS